MEGPWRTRAFQEGRVGDRITKQKSYLPHQTAFSRACEAVHRHTPTHPAAVSRERKEKWGSALDTSARFLSMGKEAREQSGEVCTCTGRQCVLHRRMAMCACSSGRQAGTERSSHPSWCETQPSGLGAGCQRGVEWTWWGYHKFPTAGAINFWRYTKGKAKLRQWLVISKQSLQH